MKALQEQLNALKVEFDNFNLQSLDLKKEADLSLHRVVYSSDLIEHLGELYYELGDYKRPKHYGKKPLENDYVATYYRQDNKVVKATRYNFNNIVLSEHHYFHENEMTRCYELEGKELVQLEVLVYKNGHKSAYCRYSSFGVSESNRYILKGNKLISIKQFTTSYLGDQNTEFKIKYQKDTLSEIIRFDERSNFFPNGQKLTIFKEKGL